MDHPRIQFSFHCRHRAQPLITSPFHVHSTRNTCNSLMIRSSDGRSAFGTAGLLHWHTAFADCELEGDQHMHNGKQEISGTIFTVIGREITGDGKGSKMFEKYWSTHK
jgi:hypothetical protein